MLETLLTKIKPYRVLVVGDAIIDEYVYVTPQGKSPKENLISHRFDSIETFRGGSWAAAAHVAGFCDTVDLHAARNVTVKRRFVDKEGLRKLFEVHEKRDDGTAVMPDPADYDAVLVTDFGHGCISQEMIETLTRRAKFLAVNAQTNSANHGFNLITKYRRADYVVLDELEARLAAHDRESPIEQVMKRLDYPRLVVTLGSHGSVGVDEGAFYRAAAVSDRVIDTMGAGDAFFCVTAPLAAAGADMGTLLQVGNAAGAIKCAVVGHRQPVTLEALIAALPRPLGAGQAQAASDPLRTPTSAIRP